MGNSLSGIKIAIIVIIVILAISFGMVGVSRVRHFADQADQKNNKNSSLNTEFNQKWKQYGDTVNGSEIKKMLGELERNSEENSNNPEFLIDLAYQAKSSDDFTLVQSTEDYPNSEEFKKAKSLITSRHAYHVEYIYSKKTNNISGIIIKYEKSENYELVPNEK